MLLEQGIQGLLAGQAALDAAPVGRALPVKGADEDWRRELARVPKDLALHLQISKPQLDTDAIVETIKVFDHTWMSSHCFPNGHDIGKAIQSRQRNSIIQSPPAVSSAVEP